MIELFITDLDGCISEPFKTPDWEIISEIRKLNIASNDNGYIPPLTICSGRPMPYVEAVAQWLDINFPVVFESAGILKPATNQISIAPVFNDEAYEQVSALKKWLRTQIIDKQQGMELEFSKLMDAGIIHPEKHVIDQAYFEVKEYVNKQFPLFEVHKTDVSINVILKKNNKGNGIEMLCEKLGLDPANVAYIGDSSGDIPGLELVGHPFAPVNAVEEVKKVAEVLDHSVTEAVLEAYHKIIKHNKRMVQKSVNS